MNIVDCSNCNTCHHVAVCKLKDQYRRLDKEIKQTITEEVCSTNTDMWFVLEERCAYYEKIGE